MSKLRRRLRAQRRSRLRRLYMINLMRRLCVAVASLVVILALVLYVTNIPTSYASFTVRAEVAPISISAGTWHMDIDNATVRIHPDTFNPSAGGRWVTAYIGLDSVDIAEIDITTVRLEYGGQAVPASWGNPQDYPDLGYVLMVKFERAAVKDMLEGVAGEVELVVAGEGNGFSFSGRDSIRVLLHARVSFDPILESLGATLGMGVPRPMEVTGCVELLDYDAGLIDVKTVRLECGEHWTGLTRSEIQGSCLSVAFDWSHARGWLEQSEGDQLFTVTGEVIVEGVAIPFAGSDYLEIAVEEVAVLSIHIVGADTLVSGTVTERYEAADELGNIVAVKWSILEPLEGVSVDEEGVVTVAGVASGSFTLIATVGDAGPTASMEVVLTQPVPEDEELEGEPGENPEDELREVDVKKEEDEGAGESEEDVDEGLDEAVEDEDGAEPDGDGVPGTDEEVDAGETIDEPSGDAIEETGDVTGEPVEGYLDVQETSEYIADQAEVEEGIQEPDPADELVIEIGDIPSDTDDGDDVAREVSRMANVISIEGLSSLDSDDPKGSWVMGDNHFSFRRERKDAARVDKP